VLTLGRAFTVTGAAAGARSTTNFHLWHILEALGFLITSLGGIAAAEFIQGRKRRRGSAVPAPAPAPATGARRRSTLLPLVAFAGAAAAGVHYAVMPEHFKEATLYGSFFAVAATTQLVYSVLLLVRPSRTLLWAGAAGNLAIVLLWLATRTIAIPLGPDAGETEAVGALDILATVFEVTFVVGAIMLLRSKRPLLRTIRPSNWSPAIWTLGPIAAIAIAVTSYVAPPS
jgi:hypothetical protein